MGVPTSTAPIPVSWMAARNCESYVTDLLQNTLQLHHPGRTTAHHGSRNTSIKASHSGRAALTSINVPGQDTPDGRSVMMVDTSSKPEKASRQTGNNLKATRLSSCSYVPLACASRSSARSVAFDGSARASQSVISSSTRSVVSSYDPSPFSSQASLNAPLVRPPQARQGR